MSTPWALHGFVHTPAIAATTGAIPTVGPPPGPPPGPPDVGPPDLGAADGSVRGPLAPMVVPGPRSGGYGTLVAGNAAGLFVGVWNDGSYSSTGGVWWRGRVTFLEGSQQLVAANATGVVVGDAVSHYNRRAFRWSAGRYQALGLLGGSDEQGGRRSSALAVSPTGLVVGWSTTDARTTRAVRWRGTRPQDLGTLGGPSSSATAVNAARQIVGSADTGDGQSHAVVWTDGRIRDLGTLGGPSSVAVAINDAGDIIGTSDTPDGSRRAVLWRRGHDRPVDLGTLPGLHGSSAIAVNNTGQVLVSASGPTQGAFLWRSGRQIPIGGATATGAGDDRVEVTGLNDQGVVCGDISTADGREVQAFRWHSGRLRRLPSAGGAFGHAQAVTPTGIVLGNSATTQDAAPQAVWWPSAPVTTPLALGLTALPAAG
ncbi:HAF repeat-containing protein [Frankia sp. Ag45/Mut15]|uniref:HAF repeat-containing protein n=1 Tax=Frankia umida TaxID=573489 RepID=A0ABT0JZC4_9ACTN|nr:HAF repeat-containing protein [Frankia umida]MCK9876887.1 HAF repeat-containing protein [Frankia umida]